MTVLWWILGILAVLVFLLALLCLMWVGVRVSLTPDSQVVDVKVGPIRFRIHPAKKKEKKAKKQARKAEKTAKSGNTEPKKKKSFPKIKLRDIKDAVRTLWPPLKRALERTRKGIRIHPLDLSVTLGGLKDPAETAKLYAYLHAGMWTAMPLLEKVIDIPDPHLHVGMDFSEAETVLEGEAALKAHVGTLLLAALQVGIPALKWFLRWKKQAKLAANQPKVSERTESNGQ